LTEITRGVEIDFNFPEQEISDIEVVSIFSGQSKYPQIRKMNNRIEVSSGEEEWIFPNSGVIFAYNVIHNR
jgi:hypothetical protein